MEVNLADQFWGPRRALLVTTSLSVMLERLEAQGAVDNFRRLLDGSDLPRRALHFSDSDLYKWLEAAVLARRFDLADPVIELVERAQSPDGYLHTYYGVDGGPARYVDLDFGHEHYCFGHLIEAAVSHHEATGSDRLLSVARRLADHLCDTFGPGLDERTDAHPEIELALGRLSAATGEQRYVQRAAWIIERRLQSADTSLEELEFSGHAVRALYLASGIAEVALATGDDRWVTCASRLFDSLINQHSYPTGAVGGRWLGEAVGKPYELPDAMSYAESCAAVAAVHFCERIWRLTHDVRALEQIELLLYNAVPCGVGDNGDTWFYSQPHAVDEVAPEFNPWAYGFEYGPMMLLEWFPARRHRWFAVACCPPNLGRLYADVCRHVAQVDQDGDLLVNIPVASTIRGDGWDVEIASNYPDDGRVVVRVNTAPPGRSVRVRVPSWAGGNGHVNVGDDGLDLPIDWQWWESDPRVEGSVGTVYLRRGPTVYCVEGLDFDGDVRDLVVDPRKSPSEAFAVAPRGSTVALHRPHTLDGGIVEPRSVTLIPYARWANRGVTTMRMRFTVDSIA